MDEILATELYRQEGAEFRSVRLAVGPDGSVRLKALDTGELVEKIWGDDSQA